jgi:hypothetical protein
VASQESLGFLSNSHSIHIDATYKLNIYGFPFMVVGFTDNSKKFFCSGLVISANEDTDTYLWIFNNIKNYLKSHNLIISAANIIADNVAQISLAVQTFDQSL